MQPYTYLTLNYLGGYLKAISNNIKNEKKAFYIVSGKIIALILSRLKI